MKGAGIFASLLVATETATASQELLSGVIRRYVSRDGWGNYLLPVVTRPGLKGNAPAKQKP